MPKWNKTKILLTILAIIGIILLGSTIYYGPKTVIRDTGQLFRNVTDSFYFAMGGHFSTRAPVSAPKQTYDPCNCPGKAIM